jgi:hypothetical protein
MTLHYAKYVRIWGEVRNFLAEAFEMAHKGVKTSARRTNWRVNLSNVVLYPLIIDNNRL